MEAISVGYRSIDTAQCYGNEKEVGIACRKSIRELEQGSSLFGWW